MIEYSSDSQHELSVRQCDIVASVYLDHCVLRKISSSRGQRERFVACLKKQNGTLLISSMNILEFSRVSDLKQIQAAEEFVAECIPNLFFIESNPFVVIERENILANGGPKLPPHSDIETFHAFRMLRPKGLELFSTQGLFEIARSGNMDEKFRKLTQVIIERHAKIREDADGDPVLDRALKNTPTQSTELPGTRFLFRELTASILRNRSMKMTHQHASDLLHVTVPFAYSDYLLLDRSWVDRTSKCARRLRERMYRFPMAQVFSSQSHQIEEFLDQWELRASTTTLDSHSR